MTNQHYYEIYGLKVQSEILLPGAYPCEQTQTPDVVAKIGKIPEFLKDSREKGYGSWTNGFVNAWFFTPNAAQFYIEHGKSIIIEPIENPNWELTGSLLLSAGLGLILLQRNEIMLHCSALEYQGKAFLVSGESGAGKSTVSFELMKKPYGFLADDTVHIHAADGIFVAEPSYPQQKICRDMAERLGLNLEKLRYIDEERDKFAKMCTERYITRSVPLKTIVILRKSKDVQKVCSQRLLGAEYIKAMIGAFYLEAVYRTVVGFPKELMFQLISMANQVEVYAVYRPEEGNTIEAVMQEIERLIGAK